jgi:hypothetical protein
VKGKGSSKVTELFHKLSDCISQVYHQCNQKPYRNDLEGGRIDFGSWFEGFQTIVLGSVFLGTQ